MFLSRFLFHVLMLSTGGEGFSLGLQRVPQQLVPGTGEGGAWASLQLGLASHASGGDVGFLLGGRAWLGVALDSQGQALKVLSPEDAFPRSCGQFECHVPGLS